MANKLIRARRLPTYSNEKGNGHGILTYVFRRLIILIPAIIVASFLLFLILRGLPGDAAMTVLSGSTHTQAMRQALREELGLNRPWYVQYLRWFLKFVSGNGESLETGEPIGSILGRQLPVTLLLSLYTIVISLGISLPLGVIAGAYRNRWPDNLIRTVTLGGLSIPAVWSALLLLLLMAKAFRWSPPIFYSSPVDSLSDHFALMIWPVLLLSWEYSSYIVRVTRATTIDSLAQEYVTVAVAKGQKRSNIIIRYVFRNSIVPPLTSAGMVFGSLIGGAVVLESIFGLPGIGRGLVQAALARDIPVVLSQACILIATYGVVNVLVDTACLVLDPRIEPGARKI